MGRRGARSNKAAVGELLEVGQQLRRLMTELDASGHLLELDWSVDPELEACAVVARPVVVGAANSVFRFIDRLERYERERKRAGVPSEPTGQ